MQDAITLDLTARHNRGATVATLSKLGAVSTVGLLVTMVVVLFFGPSGFQASDCSLERPSEACLARLPEELRDLPPADVGVWFFAENAATQRSPVRYLRAEGSWARLLPAGTTSEDMARKYDGRKPSSSALQGELRMRRAALPRLWAPRATDAGLRNLALPLGLGALVTLALTVVWFRQERQWQPLKVAVTDEQVSIGEQRRSISEVMSLEVAPLRLVTTGGDLVLPPGYQLASRDHERLVQALEQAMMRNRAQFLEEDAG